MSEYKVCGECYKRKRITEFRIDKRHFKGFRSNCKKCEQAYTKQWRLNNPDKRKNQNKKYNRSIKARFNLMTFRNKRFSQIGQMSLSDYEKILHNSKCIYCNAKMPSTGVGLDRIDNKIGYIVSNVVTCCGRCNVFRGAGISFEDMLKLKPLLRKLQNKISKFIKKDAQ